MIDEITMQARAHPDEITDSLRESPEKLAYIIGRLGNEMDVSDVEPFVADYLEDGCDTAKIASFLRGFADLVEAA